MTKGQIRLPWDLGLGLSTLQILSEHVSEETDAALSPDTYAKIEDTFSKIRLDILHKVNTVESDSVKDLIATLNTIKNIDGTYSEETIRCDIKRLEAISDDKFSYEAVCADKEKYDENKGERYPIGDDYNY